MPVCKHTVSNCNIISQLVADVIADLFCSVVKWHHGGLAVGLASFIASGHLRAYSVAK
jgi:hypothetical protein